MNHILVYPFAGAACGVMTAVTVIPVIGGNAEGTFGMTLIVGTFLAGSGAIAGAILGAAEVMRGQAPRMKTVSDQDGLKPEA